MKRRPVPLAARAALGLALLLGDGRRVRPLAPAPGPAAPARAPGRSDHAGRQRPPRAGRRSARAGHARGGLRGQRHGRRRLRVQLRLRARARVAAPWRDAAWRSCWRPRSAARADVAGRLAPDGFHRALLAEPGAPGHPPADRGGRHPRRARDRRPATSWTSSAAPPPGFTGPGTRPTRSRARPSPTCATRPGAASPFETATVALTAGYSYGWENDYRSHTLSVAARGDFLERNFTLGLAYTRNFDQRLRPGQRPGPEPARPAAARHLRGLLPRSGRPSWPTRGCRSTPSSRRCPGPPRRLLLLSLGSTLQILDGFQSNPYRAVRLGPEGREPQERLPQHRQRFALFARAHQAVPPLRAAARLAARLYRDTWDVAAASADAEWLQYFGSVVDGGRARALPPAGRGDLLPHRRRTSAPWARPANTGPAIASWRR